MKLMYQVFLSKRILMINASNIIQLFLKLTSMGNGNMAIESWISFHHWISVGEECKKSVPYKLILCTGFQLKDLVEEKNLACDIEPQRICSMGNWIDSLFHVKLGSAMAAAESSSSVRSVCIKMPKNSLL